MDSNADRGLNAPLVGSASCGQDDLDDTTLSLWSVSSFLGGSTEGTAATTLAGGEIPKGDEADAAGGGLRPPAPPGPKLTATSLAIILFFQASGGPFGAEASLKAAGNLYAIIGFAVMPFVWALPEAVMTYELSVLYPCASGPVRWTEEAFGECWGLIVGFLGWTSGVTFNAVYPVLFLSYVHTQFFPNMTATDHNLLLRFVILAGITLVLAMVNYRGLDIVGKVSTLIFLVAMTPFVLMVIIGIPKVDPQKWLQTPTGQELIFDDDTLTQQGWFPDAYLAGIAFRPFVNNLYWNFNGFDQASHYSTSVSKRALRNGIAGSFLLTSSLYMLPILIATGATDITQEDWKEGAFATAGTKIGGPWLGNWIVVGAGVSLLAQFVSEMSADSLQVQGMADRGQVPSLFSTRSPYDTPTYALLLGVSMILVLVWLPFSLIVELSNFTFCVVVTVEFFSFIQLIIRNGDHSKLRKTIYSLMLVAPLLLNIAVFITASYATYIYGACVTVFGLILINAKRANSACCSFCGRGEESV